MCVCTAFLFPGLSVDGQLAWPHILAVVSHATGPPCANSGSFRVYRVGPTRITWQSTFSNEEPPLCPQLAARVHGLTHSDEGSLFLSSDSSPHTLFFSSISLGQGWILYCGRGVGGRVLRQGLYIRSPG